MWSRPKARRPASQTAGAKDGVAQRGAHLKWVTRRAGPPDAGISTRRVPGRLGRRMLRIRPLQTTSRAVLLELFLLLVVVCTAGVFLLVRGMLNRRATAEELAVGGVRGYSG